MSIKISFMRYMKWTGVMLPVVLEKFELIPIFIAFFFLYHCQLVKGQLQQKSRGFGAPGFYEPGIFKKERNINTNILLELSTFKI